MNQDQVLSVIRSLAKVIGGMLMAHGLSKYASFLNAEDVIGLLVTAVGVITSHVTHKDDKPVTPGAISSLIIAALIIGGIGIGCAKNRLEIGGAYAPATTQLATNASGGISTNFVLVADADIAFFQVDASFEMAYNTFTTVSRIEQNNRRLLWQLSPKIKHSLDDARPVALRVSKDYAAARAAYIVSPTPAGLTTLQSLLAKSQAIAQAATAVLATDTNLTKTVTK